MNRPISCTRRPAYNFRLLMHCEDPDCKSPTRRHIVYVREGDGPDEKSDWHLDLYMHLPAELRRPETFEFNTLDLGEYYSYTMTFPRYPRDAADCNAKAQHGPMKADADDVQSLHWECWCCEHTTAYDLPRNGDSGSDRCGCCGYQKDSTCTWVWEYSVLEWFIPVY